MVYKAVGSVGFLHGFFLSFLLLVFVCPVSSLPSWLSRLTPHPPSSSSSSSSYHFIRLPQTTLLDQIGRLSVKQQRKYVRTYIDISSSSHLPPSGTLSTWSQRNQNRQTKMSITSPSCWLLHQDRFFQPGSQPAAEILSRTVALVPDMSCFPHQQHQQYQYQQQHYRQPQSQLGNLGAQNQQDHHLHRHLQEQQRKDVDAPQGEMNGYGRGHVHVHRRGVSASLKGFFRHGPRYGGAAWIELK
ncbi:hypothetical protein IWX90DRAFT_287370 [Phyllosticta citrichinensis]|uniref:Uncharacterized protein n=1 Tax=Phyllosticta citrichinensis TaxID=1130410 RepID=A0ABR1XPG6_9PEZI